jgi:hypothetical protein
MRSHSANIGGSGQFPESKMRVRQVFEQQVPCVGIGIPSGIEAFRDETR